MFRKLTLLLFLLVLAQAANALPILETIHDTPATSASFSQSDQQIDFTFDNDDYNHLFNLPSVNRLSSLLFSTERQTTPNYVLVIEFFKVKLTAGLFKQLESPPLITHWFEQLRHKTNSSRISGWKDGNFLYSSRTTYHS